MDDELITVATPRKMWRAAAKALEIALASHEQSTAGATLTRAAHPTAAPAAQSPLPAERVERVMAAAENCIYLQDQHRWGNASADDVRSALAAVRAILEGRS